MNSECAVLFVQHVSFSSALRLDDTLPLNVMTVSASDIHLPNLV